MAAFAGRHRRVRLGQMCTCMGYRNPAYLAKVAATVDVVSEGRLEMGIGAGWYEHEWRAYGYGFPRAGERLEMLREGVEIMRRCGPRAAPRTPGSTTPSTAPCASPAPAGRGGAREPAQRHPPVDRRRRRAQDPAHRGRVRRLHQLLPVPEEFSPKSEILRGHCVDVGRDFDEIVRSANYNVVIGRDEAEVQERLDWIRDHYTGTGMPADVVESTVKHVRDGPLVGTPEQIVETLVDLESRGMTYAITYFVEQAYDLSGVELFEREVIPAFINREQHSNLWHFIHGRTPWTPRPGPRSPSPTPPPRSSSCSPAPRRSATPATSYAPSARSGCRSAAVPCGPSRSRRSPSRTAALAAPGPVTAGCWR